MRAARRNQKRVAGGCQLAHVGHGFGGIVIRQVHPEHEPAGFVDEQRVWDARYHWPEARHWRAGKYSQPMVVIWATDD